MAAAPRFKFLLALVVSHLIVALPNKYVGEQKILGWFLGLTLPRFCMEPCEDAYEFLVAFMDRLCNLGFDMTHVMDYTAL